MTKIKSINAKTFKGQDEKEHNYYVVEFDLDGKAKSYTVKATVLKNACRQVGKDCSDFNKLVGKEVNNYATDWDAVKRTGGKRCVLITLK